MTPPAPDPIREKFYAMRAIARERGTPFAKTANLFDEVTRLDNARTFYKQAVFMRDFEDSYEGRAAFWAYFPYYQLMGYEQLRTYFTWRTGVRAGDVAETSLSYVFLYIYELLNNVGVENPREGLERLTALWKACRAFDDAIDKYVQKWLKDYHIYYGLPLDAYMPASPEGAFDLCCAISKYDIRQSPFYNGDTRRLIRDCFPFVLDKLRGAFAGAGLCFDDFVFHPTKSTVWTPFKDALFYPHARQPDRRVVLSESEIYLCRKNQWTFSTALALGSGRQLVGYVMKQMECVLRGAVKYKHKLSANMNAVDQGILRRLGAAGLSLEELVTQATLEFHREATKTVVSVDAAALNRIRQEALATQEKLVVAEEEAPPPLSQEAPPLSHSRHLPQGGDTDDNIWHSESGGDAWQTFQSALSPLELQALNAILQNADLKQFADANGVMLEVLADGINEKAMDCVGDSILDDDMSVFDVYIENVKGMEGL